MGILSRHCIWSLCHPGVSTGERERWLGDPRTGKRLPMIDPFEPERVVVNGKSYGLSVASYDLRIAHDLILGAHPAHSMLAAFCALSEGNRTLISEMKHHLGAMPPSFALAHTIENVAIPLHVSGQICDKSTYARLGVSCFNTLFDPGFIGNCTIELVNLSHEPVIIKAGDPICQMIFTTVDKPAAHGYAGKYQFQEARPVGAIHETT